jgi:hypothetical protein
VRVKRLRYVPGVLDELAGGLYRWTARHPAWIADHEPESPSDWPPEVGCVAHLVAEALVLVDPLVVDDAQWAELDALVEDAGRRVVVLTTLRFHGRSRADVAERYGAHLVSHDEQPPAGISRVPIDGADESMVWLEEPRALVPGDRLIGDGAGGLRMCPESWLGYLPHKPALDDLRAALRPLLELPVELVLVSHGEPVLRDGRAAIRAALYG